MGLFGNGSLSSILQRIFGKKHAKIGIYGPPNVGKTTLACAAARELGLDVYIMQATMHTRPEDLLITPVVDRQGAIRYVASPLVTAMTRGGVGNGISRLSTDGTEPRRLTR